MDDLPLRVAERSSSPYQVGATPSNTDATKVEARGIVGVLRDFAEIFADIAVGVKAAMPAGVDPDDWDDVFGNVALKAVLMHAENPECFRAAMKDANLQMQRAIALATSQKTVASASQPGTGGEQPR